MIKLVSVIVIIACVSFSDACSCMPRTNQQKYCDSEFAGLIYVLDSGTVSGTGGMQRTYNIWVISQIKGAAISPSQLITNTSSAACGVTLTAGKVYFVATSSSSPLSLYICQLYEDWSSVPLDQVAQQLQAYRRTRCFAVADPIPIGQPIERAAVA